MRRATLTRILAGIILLGGANWRAFAHPDDVPPKFEAADVHVSPKTQNPFVRTGPAHGGRYEIKLATMVDLIRIAYGFDTDKILGGPSWLEMNRYDVTARVPADSTAETHKLMLQALLADRFKLVVHKETKPLPTYALIAGKKPALKEAEGTEETGCKPQAQAGGPAEGVIRLTAAGENGQAQTLVLGPGGIIDYACRNMTMEAFVSGLPRMFGAGGALGTNPLVDETGLKGRWNFEIRWSIGILGPNMNQGERISIFEAVDKQLGLKLESRQVPTPVITVDSVNEKPTDNPPGTADVLPAIPPATEFEVASLKPAEAAGRGGFQFRNQNGGRFTATGIPLRALINQAFLINSADQLVGVPAFADSERFDIVAKAPADSAAALGNDRESLAVMIRALLADRFKMTYHTEDRQMTAYSLVAAKPKLKKADPASRTHCKNQPPSPGTPPGTRILTCQNATLALFAAGLQYMSPDLSMPVVDATGIEGGWDFTLSFSMNFGMPMMARGGGDGPLGTGPAAPADPTGGISLFDALDKELGLKLEKQKRSVPVIVIDHIEQKPTEN